MLLSNKLEKIHFCSMTFKLILLTYIPFVLKIHEKLDSETELNIDELTLLYSDEVN